MSAWTLPAPRVGPSRGWIVLGLALLIGGLAAGTALVAAAIVPTFDDFKSGPARGGTARLDEGSYTLYASSPNSGPVVVQDPEGNDVDVADYDHDFSFSRNSVEYHAVSTFRAPVTGEYTIAQPGGNGRIGVGPGIDEGRIVLGSILAAVGLVAGLALALVVLTKRSTNRNRARAQQFAELRGRNLPPPSFTG